jgi:hypothetical protein
MNSRKNNSIRSSALLFFNFSLVQKCISICLREKGSNCYLIKENVVSLEERDEKEERKTTKPPPPARLGGTY